MATENGNLVKMVIRSYSDENYETEVGDPFEVMFNPNKYTTRYEIEYNDRQPSGTAANAPSFSNMKSQDLSLDFFLDGTGVATGEAIDVQEKVDEFLEKCYTYDGEIHRNRYLRVIWSSLVFDCVLKSADISYSLFASDGSPLRAKITAKLTGFVNDELRERQQDPRSPDLTHLVVVKEGSRMDTLCYGVYKSTDYCIDVAEANDLTSFRKLKTGQQLIFPPLVEDKS